MRRRLRFPLASSGCLLIVLPLFQGLGGVSDSERTGEHVVLGLAGMYETCHALPRGRVVVCRYPALSPDSHCLVGSDAQQFDSYFQCLDASRRCMEEVPVQSALSFCLVEPPLSRLGRGFIGKAP